MDGGGIDLTFVYDLVSHLINFGKEGLCFEFIILVFAQEP